MENNNGKEVAEAGKDALSESAAAEILSEASALPLPDSPPEVQRPKRAAEEETEVYYVSSRGTRHKKLRQRYSPEPEGPLDGDFDDDEYDSDDPNGEDDDGVSEDDTDEDDESADDGSEYESDFVVADDEDVSEAEATEEEEEEEEAMSESDDEP